MTFKHLNLKRLRDLGKILIKETHAEANNRIRLERSCLAFRIQFVEWQREVLFARGDADRAHASRWRASSQPSRPNG